MTRIVFASILAICAAGGAAFAQQRGWTGDTTRDEAQARAAQMFKRLDVNQDGKLDESDRAAHMTQMFDWSDTDHNGQLSRQEFAAMKEHGPGGEHGAGGRHGKGGRPMADLADANRDGAISQAEFTAAALERFDAADTNHDGKLTEAERQAAHAATRAQRSGIGRLPAAPPPMPNPTN